MTNQNCNVRIKMLMFSCPDYYQPYCRERKKERNKDYNSSGIHRILLLQYTFEDLLDCVQASERELEEALEKLQACLINGNPFSKSQF